MRFASATQEYGNAIYIRTYRYMIVATCDNDRDSNITDSTQLQKASENKPQRCYWPLFNQHNQKT